MKIELSQHEVKLLEEALDVWERDASNAALTNTMMGLMLCPKDERESEKNRSKAEMDKALLENTRRKRVATLLRAKMYQADALASEHDLISVNK